MNDSLTVRARLFTLNYICSRFSEDTSIEVHICTRKGSVQWCCRVRIGFASKVPSSSDFLRSALGLAWSAFWISGFFKGLNDGGWGFWALLSLVFLGGSGLAVLDGLVVVVVVVVLMGCSLGIGLSLLCLGLLLSILSSRSMYSGTSFCFALFGFGNLLSAKCR